MTVEEVVARRIATDASVAALVGDRVYQLRFPQSGDWPAVRVQLVDDSTGYHLRGEGGIRRAVVQVDAVARESDGADPFFDAASVAASVNVALAGAKWNDSAVTVTGCFRESRRALYDPDDLRLVRVMQQFTVWFSRL